MRKQTKKILKSLAIVCLPILIILAALRSGLVSTAELDDWNYAISVGAVISLCLLYIVKKD